MMQDKIDMLDNGPVHDGKIYGMEAQFDRLLAERDALAARVERLEAALKTVKTWCELNRREGSVIYKPVCEALKGGK